MERTSLLPTPVVPRQELNVHEHAGHFPVKRLETRIRLGYTALILSMWPHEMHA